MSTTTTSETMTKNSKRTTPSTVMHLKAQPQQQPAPPSTAEKNANNNPQNDESNSLFVELDRMTADADAILESIRLAASAPTPKGVSAGGSSPSAATPESTASAASRARPKLTLSDLLEGQKQDALNQRNNNAEYDYGDDTDDDMTDDGSVPEQVRLDLAAELQEVEKSFSAPPRRASASTETTKEAAPKMPTTITAVSSLPVASTSVNEKKKKNVYTSWLSSPTVWIDQLLFLMIIVTWALIAITMYTIVQKDYIVLDDKGQIALFPFADRDVPESVPPLSEQP